MELNVTPGEPIEPVSPPGPVAPAGTGTPSGPAPSPPGGAPAPEPFPFHQHPRFRQLIDENRTLKEQHGQLSTRLQQLESLQRQATTAGGLTAEEQRQYQEAAVALKRVFASDPELKALLGMTNYLPTLAQGYQGVQSLTAASQRAQMESSRQHIAQLAANEGLPTDKKWLTHLTRLVAGAAMQIEQGNERYDAGDLSVLDEAFNSVKADFFTLIRQAQAQQTAQTKNKLKNLPPAPRGTPAGEPAPAKPVEGKEREFLKSLHQKGRDMIREAVTG